MKINNYYTQKLENKKQKKYGKTGGNFFKGQKLIRQIMTGYFSFTSAPSTLPGTWLHLVNIC